MLLGQWQCHEIFNLFCLKDSTIEHWTGENIFTKFLILAKIFAKNVCPRSQQLSKVK